MSNTIENVKKGKYLRKTADGKFDKIYLESSDDQVVLSSAVTISGTTYAAGSSLSTLLSAINSTGGQYRLREYNPLVDEPVSNTSGFIFYLEVSTDGGTTYSKVTTIDVDHVHSADSATSATNASYASKIGTSLAQSTIGSTTQPVYIASDGTVTAATAYSSANVASADKVKTVKTSTNANYYPTFVGGNNSSATAETVYTNASFSYNPSTNVLTGSFSGSLSGTASQATADASGNTITTTYATKTELANLEAGVTQAYVTNSETISSGQYMSLIVNKSAEQQTVTLSGIGASSTLPLLNSESVKFTDLKIGDTIYISDASKCDWFLGAKEYNGSNSTWSLTFYSIEADSPSLSGYVTGSSLTANKIVLGNGNSAVKASSYAITTTSSTNTDTDILTSKATQSAISTALGSHSGIDNTGTVTSVAISNGGGLSVSGSPVTSSGTITVSHAVPTGASATTLGSTTARTYIQTVTTDAYGHVTGVTTGSESVNDSNNWRAVQVKGTEKLGSATSTGALNFKDGTGISVAYDSGVKFSLATTGISAGTYSALTIDTYGRATAGAQMIKFDTESNFASGNYSDLAINGVLITTGA